MQPPLAFTFTSTSLPLRPGIALDKIEQTLFVRFVACLLPHPPFFFQSFAPLLYCIRPPIASSPAVDPCQAPDTDRPQRAVKASLPSCARLSC